MKCYEVQGLLVGYLDGELPEAQQALVEAHLGWCAACQADLNSLSGTREIVGLALHHMGDPEEAPLQAWGQLEARLARETGPQPARRTGLFDKTGQWLSGGIVMSGRLKVLGLTVSGAALATALVLAGYFFFNAPTPVSAQEIIQRAQRAQAAAAKSTGIEYARTENYTDYKVLSSGTPDGTTLVSEFYENLKTSQFRSITYDGANGNAVRVFAFDGANLYSNEGAEGGPAEGASPLTVYTGAAPKGWVENYGIHNGPQIDQKEYFDYLSANPDTQSVQQEKWIDGRQVYVLRSSVPLTKFQMISGGRKTDAPPDDANAPKGTSSTYFDATTYELVESKITAQVGGQEVRIVDYKVLEEKHLPANAPVKWDLSDVTGIALVQDPTGEKLGGPWIITTTVEDLVADGLKVYKLKDVPAGFTEHVAGSEPGAQEKLYLIEYKNADDGFADFQTGHSPQDIINNPDVTYTTTSGLKVYLQGSDTPEELTHKPFWFVAVVAPDATFVITSNLPSATLKTMLENTVEMK